MPQDIPSFLSVLEDFPFQAKKTNGGRGVPVTVELVPLHELSARLLALKPSSLLWGTLSDLEEKFNDLLLTHNSIRSLSGHPINDYDKKCKVGGRFVVVFLVVVVLLLLIVVAVVVAGRTYTHRGCRYNLEERIRTRNFI